MGVDQAQDRRGQALFRRPPVRPARAVPDRCGSERGWPTLPAIEPVTQTASTARSNGGFRERSGTVCDNESEGLGG